LSAEQGTDSAAARKGPWTPFSILITNVDDHLRNHGFLHVDRGQWRLAPAFDVNPFPDRVRELKTRVSEDAGPEATIQALLSALPYFRIAAPRARQMLREVEHAVSQWRAALACARRNSISSPTHSSMKSAPRPGLRAGDAGSRGLAASQTGGLTRGRSAWR
jgi:hypothetical protein